MKRQKLFKMCEFSDTDGTYSVPMVTSGTSNRFLYFISPFFNRNHTHGKIICNEGENSIKGFEFSLLHVENIKTLSLQRIFVGIYKTGTRKPVWHQTINEESWTKSEISFILDDIELATGHYFLLFGNIMPDRQHVHFTREFAGCHRMDFFILPNGQSLSHPNLISYKISYIGADDIDCLSYREHPNYMMHIRGFPIYELEIGIDSVPDRYMDRYDLMVFDEGLSCSEIIEDAIHNPAEKISFIPPSGIPHGTGHYIIYHNGTPFIHLQCRRNKRFGKLKAEDIHSCSIFRYLHRNRSLQLYGQLKKRILHLLQHPEIPIPEYLCIIDDVPYYTNVIRHILDDLYQQMPYKYLFDDMADRYGKEDIMEESGVIVWDLYCSSERTWKTWSKYIGNSPCNGCRKLIIYGSSQKVNALFRKHCNISRLFSEENIWPTGPFSEIEKLYISVGMMSRNSNWYDFDTYEKLYEKSMSHSPGHKCRKA